MGEGFSGQEICSREHQKQIILYIHCSMMKNNEKKGQFVLLWWLFVDLISEMVHFLVKCCYDCGFISAKTNGPDFGIKFDTVC